MARIPQTPSIVEMKNMIAEAVRMTSLRPTLAGYKPLPHQKDFHETDAVGRLFIGGNRSGKTVAEVAEAVMWLEGKHPVYSAKFPPPVRGRAIGVDFDNGVELILIPEFKKWISPSMLIDQSWEKSYNKTLRQLTLVNGSTIEFRSYDQDIDKFAGTSRHFVCFDEEPPEAIFNENMARLVDTGGRWWMAMTPLIDMSWTQERLFEAGKTGSDPNVKVFEVKTTDNTHINTEAMQILYAGLSEAERNARIAGEYQTYSGLIYKDSIKSTTFIDPVVGTSKFDEIRGKWGHFLMLDHGYTNPTACLFGAFDSEGRIIIYDEYYERRRTIRENAKEIRARIKALDIDPQYGVIDPTTRNTDPITGTSIIIEYAENGLYFIEGNNDVRAGIERVMSRLNQNLLFITNNCINLKKEMTARYRWAKFASAKIASKNNLKEVPDKKDDHACDALRYGVASRPALFNEIDMAPQNVLDKPVAMRLEAFKDTEFGHEDRYVDETLGEYF
jgi:phage terminase large subunit-like protein